ncbi:cation:proton antiporter subunit C [Thiohalocapsa marina]|uniref:Cation:proton antiporter subunit C n=1 Tax=Thiohalocapsa marina TaxID=424902 RepID=A0A5M8FV40_9GAMM|nr:cation:proton antiporter subunit C [Thiohalocapsa marina]KAA6187684.1 cation:proton antiporter subunit C [Thiohalocapsa marina]
MELLGQYNYWVVFFLMMTGFYVVIARGNLVAKIVGLNIFQTSVFLLYISMGKVSGGTAPIVADPGSLYSNPLPHVLILTAIVVGVATTALGLALVVRIKEAYGTVEEDEIYAQDDPPHGSAPALAQGSETATADSAGEARR